MLWGLRCAALCWDIPYQLLALSWPVGMFGVVVQVLLKGWIEMVPLLCSLPAR